MISKNKYFSMACKITKAPFRRQGRALPGRRLRENSAQHRSLKWPFIAFDERPETQRISRRIGICDFRQRQVMRVSRFTL